MVASLGSIVAWLGTCWPRAAVLLFWLTFGGHRQVPRLELLGCDRVHGVVCELQAHHVEVRGHADPLVAVARGERAVGPLGPHVAAMMSEHSLTQGASLGRMTPISTEAATRAAPLPPDERRAAIIDAVLPLLAEQGESATSRQLAAVAGVSEGTIFKVFDDKSELFRAALERVLDPAPITAAIEAIDRTLPFEEQLLQSVELIQQRIVGVWQLVTKLREHHAHHNKPTPLSDSPALTDLLAAASDRLRVDPARAATLLRALTLSLSHPMLVAEPLPGTDIVDHFLHGVGRRP